MFSVVENPDSNLPNAEEKLTKSSSSTVSSQDPNQQLNGHFVPSSGNAETPTASDAPQEMWPGIGSDRTGTKSKQPHPVHSHSHMHWEKYPWTPEVCKISHESCIEILISSISKFYQHRCESFAMNDMFFCAFFLRVILSVRIRDNFLCPLPIV